MSDTTERESLAAADATSPTISRWLTFTFAAACGLIGANIYYSQPLAGIISRDLGFTPEATGLIVTLTQIGYCLGLLFIVPLGDLFENRRLVLVLIATLALSLVGAAVSSTPESFLLSCFAIGLAGVAIQVLVPFAANMASEASRGRVVGNVMSGLLLGIMVARPVASFLSEMLFWHAVYVMSAGLMTMLAIALRVVLPTRIPPARMGYGGLMVSMWHLATTNRVLQRRALYQACMFATFSLFWTTSPLLLASPSFGFTQSGIALFALAGAAGAIASPIAGRLADLGHSRATSLFAMAAAVVAMAIAHFSDSGSVAAVAMITLSGILLDFGVQANLVVGQRTIYALGDDQRSRLNGLYMATFFAGGAMGSAVGGWAFATGGWRLAAEIGLCFPILGLALFATEGVRKRA